LIVIAVDTVVNSKSPS